MNNNLEDEFDIGFGLWDLSYSNDCDRIRKEITSYIYEKLNITMKDEKKWIFSNTKGNTVFLASQVVRITLPSKICFKTIIISTKDTVVGVNRCLQGESNAKPKNFHVRLSSWNDDKTRENLFTLFSVKVEDKDDYTSIIHNYAPLKVTGNTTISYCQ